MAENMEFTEHHIIIKNGSWWDNRTSLERRIMVITFALFLLVIGLIICIAVLLLKTERYDPYYPNIYPYESEPYQEMNNIFPNEPYMLCLDPGCVHAASDIIKLMDRSIDPCENFYRFSCGGFLNDTSVPGDADSFGSIDLDRLQIQARVKSILDETAKHTDPKPITQAKRLYQQCMDTTSIERDNLQTMKSMIKTLGGWPALEGYEWNESRFDWLQAVHKLRRFGFNENIFLTVEVSSVGGNSSQHILVLDQAFIDPKEELFLLQGLGSDFITTYYGYMVDIAVLFGADLTFAINDMKKALEFEIALAKISVQKRDNDTFLYDSMSLSFLQTKYPDIPWLEYLKEVVDLSDVRLTYQDPVIVRVPQYLTEFENLQKWNSKRVLANYLMWRVVKSSVDYLTGVIRDRKSAFYRDAYGLEEKRPRWEECIDLVEKGMPFVTGYLYAEVYVPKEAKELVYEMVTGIRAQLSELIKGADWMDETTRISAQEKAEAIVTHAAFSREFMGSKKLIKYYTELELPRNNFLKSVLNLNVFKKDKYYKKLNKYVLQNEWDETDYTPGIRPYYSVTQNKLIIPNGVLHGSFFTIDRPHYLNYGGLGYLISREISNGFDSTGRFYDKYGKNVEWWSDFTRRAFFEKAKCLTFQHRNRTVADIDLYIDGLVQQDANMANQAGLKLAYFAYNSWMERYGYEYLLPSMKDYTPQQLFWIAAVQTQCEKYDPKTIRRDGYSNGQSPAQIRVHESIKNLDYFSRDFGCRLGSTMNPARKCHVW